MKVCLFVFAIGFVRVGAAYLGPGSEAADVGIRRSERDVGECVSVHHATCPGVCLVVVHLYVIPV